MTTQPPTTTSSSTPVPESEIFQNHLPRITIKYCTQCKWLLRAAYFAQELLSTFSTQLGEVALVPVTGGVFTVTIYCSSTVASTATATATATSIQSTLGDGVITSTVLWDRKLNGGFPEVKVLKSLVRNVVDPGRDLGHTDRALRAKSEGQEQGQKEDRVQKEEQKGENEKTCEECQ